MIRRILYLILFVLTLCNLYVSIVKADSLTLAQVTQQIKTGSVLTLRNDVAQDLAENLLAAQQPGVCSYCAFEADSLQLSINAVLKAITLEKSFGLRYCDDATCNIVWQQSNIAIDDRVSIGFSSTALYFGEVPLSTPEPGTLALCVVALALLCFSGRKQKTREYPATHAFRKGT